MDKVIGAICSGKTSELIRRSAKDWHNIVCVNPHHVAITAKEMGIDIPFPLSFGEFMERRYSGKGIKGFIIDQADMLLQQFSTVPISTISMNNEGWLQLITESFLIDNS